LLLALCNDILIDPSEPGKYNASSPDELALINFARFSGVQLESRSFDGKIVIKRGHTHLIFQLLNTLEFSSNRKRMSVIVRDQDGNIMLFCKGADSVMIPRIGNTDQVEDMNNSLMIYSMLGLRTLVLGSRCLDQKEYDLWSLQY
jgi:magnesium-transporting ATPase (P-type)